MYKVPEAEKHLYHVELIRKEFDKDTGKPLFAPFVQKYTPGEYANFLKYPHGYTVKAVVHDPTATEEVKPESKGKFDTIKGKK